MEIPIKNKMMKKMILRETKIKLSQKMKKMINQTSKKSQKITFNRTAQSKKKLDLTIRNRKMALLLKYMWQIKKGKKS